MGRSAARPGAASGSSDEAPSPTRGPGGVPASRARPGVEASSAAAEPGPHSPKRGAPIRSKPRRRRNVDRSAAGERGCRRGSYAGGGAWDPPGLGSYARNGPAQPRGIPRGDADEDGPGSIARMKRARGSRPFDEQQRAPLCLPTTRLPTAPPILTRFEVDLDRAQRIHAALSRISATAHLPRAYSHHQTRTTCRAVARADLQGRTERRLS